jgi:hypothetical protein
MLNLEVDSSNEHWESAIDIFKDRLESRFILVIQDMLGKLRSVYIDYSFSIMGLNCLLIEAIRQFELGLDATETYRGANEYAFRDFFSRSQHFEFTPRLSKIFYKHVRCGILHQAQTQGNTQLTFGQDEMVKFIDEESIRVDVEIFTYALFAEYEDYLTRLQNPREVEIRNKFIKKMNFIVNRIR